MKTIREMVRDAPERAAQKVRISGVDAMHHARVLAVAKMWPHLCELVGAVEQLELRPDAPGDIRVADALERLRSAAS